MNLKTIVIAQRLLTPVHLCSLTMVIAHFSTCGLKGKLKVFSEAFLMDGSIFSESTVNCPKACKCLDVT